MIMYKLFIYFLNFIYLFFKILPTNKKKIFFLSRQSNNISLDYKMLIDEIKEKYPEYKIVVYTKMMGKSLKSKFLYFKDFFIQMFHLATSKTCVIDGYNVSVSVLKHKKNLKIIQIWHALGAIKKFGYQTLDKKSGTNSKVAKVMKMHYNYDYIVTGSTAMIPYFSEAFNQSVDKFINCGLPRIDYLIKEQDNNKNKIYQKYPKLKNKKIILYVPTFRKGEKYHIEKLYNLVDQEKYELIIKGHPIKKLENKGVEKDFNSLELLSIADYIITDYSAISIEASIYEKPLYFYVYDLDEYKESTGLNIDLEKEMKGCVFKKPEDIINSIEKNDYNYKKLKKYRKKYIDNLSGNSTEKLVKYIVGEL